MVKLKILLHKGVTVLLVVLLSFAFNNSFALEFSRIGGTLAMSGKIEKNDWEKFLVEFTSWDVAPTIFHIDSPGGNITEAIKIGTLIRESYIPVWSGEKCLSACVFIFVAGVERRAEGAVGLHRPYYEKEYFKDLNVDEAKKKYEELKSHSISYLLKMGVPQQVINRIFQTSSSNIDYIAQSDVSSVLGYRLPFYDEWLTAKCGGYTSQESKVIGSYVLFSAMRDAAVLGIPIEGLPENALEEAKLAEEMEKSGTLKPYIEIKNKYEKCIDKSSNGYIISYHKAVQKMVEERFGALDADEPQQQQ